MVTTTQLDLIAEQAEPPDVIVKVMAVDIVRVMHMDARFIVQSLISKGYTLDEVREHMVPAADEAKRILLTHGDLEASDA